MFYFLVFCGFASLGCVWLVCLFCVLSVDGYALVCSLFGVCVVSGLIAFYLL